MVLDANAEASARTAHCRSHDRWVARNRPGLANHVLAFLAECERLIDPRDALGTYAPAAPAFGHTGAGGSVHG